MADNVISKIKLPDNQEYILKDSNAARSGHIHDIALEKDTSGTNQLTLAAGTKYKLTAGGESYIFTTPADANNKVTIAADTTTNANYPLVFGSTNTSTTTAKTEGLQKSTTKFYVNPSTGNIQATTFNGIALTAAAGKSITDNSSNADVTSSDTNLITGRTLYYQLAKKGYTTNTGTVTNVATGAGLTGGPIATTGTIKANLTSDDKLANAAADGTETAGRVYPVRLDKNGKLAVNVPWTNVNGSYLTSITTTGNGNAITAVEKSGQSITFTKGSTFLTSVPNSFLKWQTTTSASTDLYDFGVYVNQNNAASSSMTGSNYFSILNIPYRKASGNTKADWGWQIGNTTSNDGRLWYRTTGDNVWGDWQIIAHATQSTNSIGSATQPVYMTATGVITPGTPLKNLAYKDSLSASDIPELAASKITSETFDTARIPNLAWSKITSGKPTTLSGYGITDAKIDGGVITLGSNTITPVTSVNGHTGNVVNVTAGDLGLSSALRYVGKTTSTMSESFTGVPAGISGYTKPIVGDVVLDSAGNGEYVCVGVSGTTYTWESLGSESSFKKVQTAVSSPSAGNSAQIEFINTISQDVQGVISATKQPIRIASKTQTGVIQITKDNANLFLNTLDTGSSTPTDNDYYISQYVGGGTTTTTYHRRPVSALYSYIKGKTDTLYPTKAGGGATGTWGISISGNAATATTATKFASAQSITLTGDTTGTKSSQAGWSIPTTTSKMSGLGRKSTAESIAINQTTDIGGKLAWNIYDSSARNADAENTPSFDASVINIPWDWGAYNGQIAISSTSNVAPRMQIRTANHKDNGSEANPRYTPLYTAWREIVTVPKDSAVGGDTQPVYINNIGQVVPGTALGTAAYKATGDFATSGHNHDSTYLKLTGGTMSGNILGNATATLGSTTNPWHQLVLGGATSATVTSASTNPRITFQESNNGSQPVHLIYSDYDNYRSPAGLKVVGGTSATPAWFEVEGNIYAAAFKGNADTATTATNLASKPSLAVSDTTKITVTAGGKTSDAFTVPYASNAGAVAWTNVTGKPNDFTPSSHTHGNITNDGKIGATANYAVYTTTSGTVTAGSLAVSAPTANGTATAFITSVSQDSKGQISASKASIPEAAIGVTGLVNTTAQTFGGTKTFNGGAHFYGSIDGSSLLYSGGAYHGGHNTIILHGDSAGVSGIGFTSQKATDSATITNINSPSDRAFIQYHAYGVTQAAEGTAPTLATSGEAGRLVIGVGNDAGDKILLQAPSHIDVMHTIGNTNYVIPDTGNQTGSVGGATTPVYVEAGVIKAGTALKALAYKDSLTYSDVGAAATSHAHGNIANGGTITSTAVALANGDNLLFADSSNNGKIERSSITIGTATNTWLCNNGTWTAPTAAQVGAVALANGVTAVTWDSTNKKITRTINGTAADVVTFEGTAPITVTGAANKLTIAHNGNSGYKHIPSGGSSGQFLGWDSDGTAKWVANPNTDTKVTSVGNHYTPAADTNSQLSASASGATAAWSIDVVKAVQLQRDAKGHVTGVTVTSGKIPANPNTDTKVTNTLGTTTKFYITGTTTSTTNTGTQYFDTGVYVSATAGELVANQFTGALNGTASIANKLGVADKGSGTKPIYLAAGVPTECSTYAGGTAVTLNGTSKAASTASFYAPTSAGSNTQALVGGPPTWTSISPSISIGAGTASAAPTVNVNVLGQSGTAQSITTASTAVYGVTKLQDGVSSDSTVLAATAKAAKTASTSATHTLATTTKFFVTGCTSSTTNTAGDDFDTGVYVTATAGEFSAVRHSYNVAGAERAYTHYNMTDQSIDFIFV